MTEEGTTTRRKANRAWIALGFAAACLLAALMFNPLSMLTKELCRDSELMNAVCMFGSMGALLAFFIALPVAVQGFLSPASSRGRTLHTGDFLGKGPYRRYDCTPTEQLVEGIATSIERAAEELPATDRDRTVAIVARVRQHAAGGAFHEATVAAAEAIAIFSQAVEAARSNDTRITPKPPAHTSPHDPA
jgi:hypothetical protein